MPSRWRRLPSLDGGLAPGVSEVPGHAGKACLEVVALKRVVAGRPVEAVLVVSRYSHLLLETRPSERWVEEAVTRGRLWRAAKETK